VSAVTETNSSCLRFLGFITLLKYTPTKSQYEISFWFYFSSATQGLRLERRLLAVVSPIRFPGSRSASPAGRRRGLHHEDVDSNQQTPLRQSPLLPIWIMDNYTPPLSLTILGAIFLLTGAICACIITIDIVIRKGWQTMMWIM
jgi:hypothetical protein